MELMLKSRFSSPLQVVRGEASFSAFEWLGALMFQLFPASYQELCYRIGFCNLSLD